MDNITLANKILEYNHDILFNENEGMDLFQTIQEKFFFGEKSNYWKIKPCKLFIESYSIAPIQFITFLDALFKFRYPFAIADNGHKGAFMFIKKLETSKSFGFNFAKQFKVRKEDRINFLRDMKSIKQKYHLGKSQEDWIRLIFNEVDTGYSYNTLRKTYIDKA